MDHGGRRRWGLLLLLPFLVLPVALGLALHGARLALGRGLRLVIWLVGVLRRLLLAVRGLLGSLLAL